MAEDTLHKLKITGPQMSTTFQVQPGATTIGRHGDNDLNFIHPLVSRRHARISLENDECTITDLGSTHGTMVNRQRLAPESPVLLESGDVIEIGAFWMLYERSQVISSRAPEPQPPSMEAAAAPAAVEEAVSPLDEPYSPLEEVEQIVGESPAEDGIPQEEPPDWKTTTAYAASFVEPPPPPRPPHRLWADGDNGYEPPPGLSLTHSRYIEYLPDLYWGNGNDFIIRFLALLESLLEPIKWNVDHFELFLDPETAPSGFLPWLASWFDITFDESWREESRRRLLADAHEIYQRRGTVWALQRILEIYTGTRAQIDDQNPNLDPFTFVVRIPLPEERTRRSVVERLIDANKPAHTSYRLLFMD